MKKVEIKDRIKEALELRNLTQAELASKAHIDKGQLSSYLSGKYKPRQNNIEALATALNVNEAWLMGYDAPRESLKDTLRTMQVLDDPLWALGWSYKYVPTESPTGSYMLFESNNGITFKMYGDDFNNLINDSLSFIDKRIQEILNKYSSSLYSNLLAAHDRSSGKKTPEGQKHDLDIMDNDSKW